MKRIIVFVLLFVILSFTLCACKNSIDDSTVSDKLRNTQSAATTENAHETHFPATTDVAYQVLPFENFTVFSDVGDKINAKFGEENRTYGAFYGDSENVDETCPKARIWTIQSQSDYAKKFDHEIDQTPMDYDRQIYVLYTFTSVYHRPFQIDSVENREDGMLIMYTLKAPETHGEPVADATRPFQYFVLIKTDKSDVKNFEFQES